MTRCVKASALSQFRRSCRHQTASLLNIPMVALPAASLCSTSACLSSASGSVTIGDARGWNDAFGVGLTAAYGINKLLHVPLNTSIIFKYGGTHTVFVADSEA